MSRFAMLSLLALAACAGAEAEPKTSASPSSAAPPADFVAQCEVFFTRARACTDSYIPALVDLRIELDKPAGIAEAARTEGRDAIIAQAMEEWSQDSQPAAITALCNQLASTMPQQVPPAELEASRAEAERCMALSDCGEYSTCAMGLQRQRMR